MMLRNATVLHCFVDPAPVPDGTVSRRCDIVIADGRIVSVTPHDVHAAPDAADKQIADLDGGMVWPCFVDLHTHLDKAHILPRAANPDGTFAGAIASAAADRATRWHATDITRRADFALRCAYVHGTRAMRTHLDSVGPQTTLAWQVFDELRAAWAGRIALQAAALFPIELARDRAALENLAALVVRHGGILGGVPTMSADLDDLLDTLLGVADAHGLDLDLHVDETMDRNANALLRIAETALRRRFAGRIVVGHCCSLALQPPAAIERTLALAGDAKLAVVSLPMCNMYLQDRAPRRTPRWRGVTLLQEMQAAGISVAVASDNCRDPFYPYGDHDMAEVFREATRIAQLDHPSDGWPASVTTTPAAIGGFPSGRVAAGEPADLLLFRARTVAEWCARPQAHRVVLRGGTPIERVIPDHRELDDLMQPA